MYEKTPGTEKGIRNTTMPQDFTNPFHFGMRTGRRTQRSLSVDDVANQSRLLLTRFIHDRMIADGLVQAPPPEEIIEPDTPTGPPLQNISEVAHALKVIGDELDNDHRFQSLVDGINVTESRQTFFSVASKLFADGNFNWGRVVALFYFAYKLVVKAIRQQLDQIPFLRTVVEWTVHFIMEHVATWIIERGGWESIEEYFGATTLQAVGILMTGVLLSIILVVMKRWW